MKKKTVVLIICVAVALMAIRIFAAVKVVVLDKDKCGKDLTWSLSDDDVLTISGSGEMYDYDYSSSRERGWKEEYTGGPYEVIIEEGVTSVGAEAFMGCANTDTVILPESLTKIGEKSFYGCWSLEKIEIPENVMEIGEKAFFASGSLEEIKVSEDNPYFSSDEFGVLFNKDKSKLICFPGGLYVDCYDVPESVISVANNAFFASNGLSPICNLRFKGDAPDFGKRAFEDEQVTIYYPAENETWEDVIDEDFGGEITWISYNAD